MDSTVRLTPHHQQRQEEFAQSSQPTSLYREIQKIMLQEGDALLEAARRLDPVSTEQLLHQIIACSGKIIVSGLGKSFLIGKKIAATLCSLGIAALSVHAHDALHGDLGIIQHNDFFIGISKSSRGIELEKIFTALNRQQINNALICCTDGPLSQRAHIVVSLECPQEACAFNLAPTTSSTITLAFGDALAIVGSSRRGITVEQYAFNHQGGTLGKQLAGTVEHFMLRDEALPLVTHDDQFPLIIDIINRKKIGLALVVDHNNKLLGIITDGDIRRACQLHGVDIFTRTAEQIMTHHPKTILPTELAYRALELMETYSITSLIVTSSEHHLLGIIHLHDLVKAGLR